MWVKISDFALEKGIQTQSIRKYLRNYAELKSHYKKDGQNTYIDDFAVNFINEHSNNKILYNRTANAEDREQEKGKQFLNLQESYNILSQNYFELNNQFIELTNRHNEQIEELHRANESITKIEYDKKILELEKDSLKGKISELEQSKATDQEEKEKIKAELCSQIDGIKMELDAKLEDIKSLNADITKQKAEYTDLKTTYEHTDAENKAKTDEISRLNEEMELLKAELEKERNKGFFARLFNK